MMAMFLDGKSDAVIDELVAAMERSSNALEFERAARLRDQIATLKKLLAKNYVQGASADLDAIATAYKTQFRQQAVLTSLQPSCVTF